MPKDVSFSDNKEEKNSSLHLKKQKYEKKRTNKGYGTKFFSQKLTLNLVMTFQENVQVSTGIYTGIAS